MVIFYKDKKNGEKVYIPNSFDKMIYKNYKDGKALYIPKEKILDFIKKEGIPFEEKKEVTNG